MSRGNQDGFRFLDHENLEYIIYADGWIGFPDQRVYEVFYHEYLVPGHYVFSKTKKDGVIKIRLELK